MYPPASMPPPAMRSSPSPADHIEPLALLAAICASPSARLDFVGPRRATYHASELGFDLSIKSSTEEEKDLSHSMLEPCSPTTTLAPMHSPSLSDGKHMEDSHRAYRASASPQKGPESPCRGQEYFTSFTPFTPATYTSSSPSHDLHRPSSRASERSVTAPVDALTLPKFGFAFAGGDMSKDLADEKMHGEADMTMDTDNELHLENTSDIVYFKSEPVDVTLSSPELDPAPVSIASELRNHTFNCDTRSQPTIAFSLDSPLSPLSSPLPSERMAPLTPSLDPCSPISTLSSLRSLSPDIDDVSLSVGKPTKARRASMHVLGETPLNGVASPEKMRRFDTAPPEPSPRKYKRPRDPSPCSSQPRPERKRRALSTSSSSDFPSPVQRAAKLPKQVSANSTTKSKQTRRVKNQTKDRDDGSKQTPSKGKKRATKHNEQDENDPTPSRELAALPITGFLVETLALSRVSALPASELLHAVLRSQPHLLAQQSEKEWLKQVRHILQRLKVFGRIERRGTDAADRPLEDHFFYIPDNDPEDGRAELLKSFMPKKRAVTKKSKQYYYEPVHISRWDPEESD